MTATCKTCKWWEYQGEYDGSSLGECALLSEGYEGKVEVPRRAVPAYSMGRFGYGSNFYANSDFGCNQHEASDS